MWRTFRLLIFLSYTCCCIVTQARTVNPLQYGIKESKNGIERYEALLRCHQDAVKNGFNICYRGIDTIRIEIPCNFTSIPLPDRVDFSGVTILVENKQKDCFLFDMRAVLTPITLCGIDIDKGLYDNYPELKMGKYLLIIEDAEPWCIRESGTPVTRKEAIVIKNGRALNKPIMGYNSSSSKPVANYRRIVNKKKHIKNLNFVRSASSTRKTFCFEIENQYNVEVIEISITTPQNTDIYGDAAMHFDNCARLTLNDICINGTYSLKDKFGYGVGMVNVSGLRVNRMFARCNWGVFGTQSLNDVILKDCDINRFDIHCYGRDVRAEKCKFSGLYNQVSSVYGTIAFIKCEYTDFIPLLIESSYNAYTPFDLVWEECVFHLNEKNNYILTLFGVPEAFNARPELKRKSLPNISLKNCKVILTNNMENWMLVKTGGLYYKEPFDYITDISIKNLKTEGNNNAEMKLFSEDIKTSVQLNVNIR